MGFDWSALKQLQGGSITHPLCISFHLLCKATHEWPCLALRLLLPRLLVSTAHHFRESLQEPWPHLCSLLRTQLDCPHPLLWKARSPTLLHGGPACA